MSLARSTPLLPGSRVELRSWPEIQATLDENGMLEGLPFMPEMARLCAQRFTVRTRVERTCAETEGSMRRIRNVVVLEDLRCDGSAHGGCQKGCSIFWKEAWLKRIDQTDGDAAAGSETALQSTAHYPYPCVSSDGRHVCQSTQLAAATSPLRRLDLGAYLRDLRARTYSVPKLIRLLSYALLLRLKSRVTRKPWRFLEGRQTRTPAQALNLEAGEWVKVKSKEEIARTLDVYGRNRGLTFTVEMLPFCGRTFRVLRRLDKMIDEPSGRLVPIAGTVLLDNVTCDGCHSLRGGCPRGNYHFWREIWLERVQPA